MPPRDPSPPSPAALPRRPTAKAKSESGPENLVTGPLHHVHNGGAAIFRGPGRALVPLRRGCRPGTRLRPAPQRCPAAPPPRQSRNPGLKIWYSLHGRGLGFKPPLRSNFGKVETDWETGEYVLLAGILHSLPERVCSKFFAVPGARWCRYPRGAALGPVSTAKAKSESGPETSATGPLNTYRTLGHSLYERGQVCPLVRAL